MGTRRGFTLIELLVGITVFVFVVAIASGLFVTAVRLQRRILAQQELLDQVSYAMEYMSRALRTAQKELGTACLSRRGLNFERTARGGIKFINDAGQCQEFFLDATTRQVKVWKEGTEEALTSPAIEIVAFEVAIAGELQEDLVQPRVTLLLEARGEGKQPEERPSVRVQTTVSQRNLDVRE